MALKIKQKVNHKKKERKNRDKHYIKSVDSVADAGLTSQGLDRL